MPHTLFKISGKEFNFCMFFSPGPQEHQIHLSLSYSFFLAISNFLSFCPWDSSVVNQCPSARVVIFYLHNKVCSARPHSLCGHGKWKIIINSNAMTPPRGAKLLVILMNY